MRNLLLSSGCVLLAAVHPTFAQSPARWKAHDMSRPRPPVVPPARQALPVPAPPDALVLFDGTSLAEWRSADGGSAKWVIKDGAIESVPGSGYLYSARAFGDVQLHVEWAAPVPARGEGQGRGNSGVFLMGLYEVQVLDSYQNDTYPDGQAAAIYGQYPPLVNACRPPGEWQTYDIVFRRPRFRPDGSLFQPARVTVLHNGILVQDAVEPWGPTAWLQHLPYTSHPDELPLGFQDHGNPVRYRNIWLRELPEEPAPGPAKPDPRPVVNLEAASIGYAASPLGCSLPPPTKEAVMRTTHVACALVSAALLSALPAAAEEEIVLFGTPYALRPGDPPVDTYGLNLNTSVIQVSRWREVQSGITWQHPIPGYLNITATSFSPNLYAPLELDAGVEVTQVCARVYDNSNTLEVLMLVGAFESATPTSAPAFAALEVVGTGTTATPGYTLLCATVDPVLKIRTDADINNDTNTLTVQYWVGFTLPVGTTTAVGPAVVTWRRTVSPGPLTATFADVPTTHPFFRFVEALAAAGITGGCGSGNYCPNDPITRGQMAVFLSSALGLYWPN